MCGGGGGCLELAQGIDRRGIGCLQVAMTDSINVAYGWGGYNRKLGDVCVCVCVGGGGVGKSGEGFRVSLHIAVTYNIEVACGWGGYDQ